MPQWNPLALTLAFLVTCWMMFTGQLQAASGTDQRVDRSQPSLTMPLMLHTNLVNQQLDIPMAGLSTNTSIQVVASSCWDESNTTESIACIVKNDLQGLSLDVDGEVDESCYDICVIFVSDPSTSLNKTLTVTVDDGGGILVWDLED